MENYEIGLTILGGIVGLCLLWYFTAEGADVEKEKYTKDEEIELWVW